MSLALRPKVVMQSCVSWAFLRASQTLGSDSSAGGSVDRQGETAARYRYLVGTWVGRAYSL